MSIVIRQATPADAAVVVEFNRLLALESEGKTLDLDVLSRGVAAGLADRDKAIYFVAEEDGQPVGQLMLTREWSDWRNGWIWWIQSVYVSQSARRRGIFRALYQHAHAEAKADPEVIGLRLYMEKENHTAERTYLALGMEMTSYVVLERCPLE
jgi:GNAT superfamily N-acetyltransferase